MFQIVRGVEAGARRQRTACRMRSQHGVKVTPAHTARVVSVFSTEGSHRQQHSTAPAAVRAFQPVSPNPLSRLTSYPDSNKPIIAPTMSAPSFWNHQDRHILQSYQDPVPTSQYCATFGAQGIARTWPF